jgi:hypothetical protein
MHTGIWQAHKMLQQYILSGPKQVLVFESLLICINFKKDKTRILLLVQDKEHIIDDGCTHNKEPLVIVEGKKD